MKYYIEMLYRKLRPCYVYVDYYDVNGNLALTAFLGNKRKYHPFGYDTQNINIKYNKIS